MNQILVTSYTNPDLDGIAGIIAYGEFLHKINKKVVVGIFGEPHDEAKYILDRFSFEYPKKLNSTEDFNQVILVDASDLKGLDNNIPPEKVVEIIDHRKVHEADKFPNAKVQIESVGAAATLIAERFIENNIEMSKESSTLLYGAILSNTLNFKGTVTTDRDRKSAFWLNKIAKLSKYFWKELFLAKSDLSGSKLSERIERDFALFVLGEKRIGIAQIEMIGARELICQRGNEIIKTLQQLKKSKMNNLDCIFLNAIELEHCYNIFVTDEDKSKQLLEKVFGIKFSKNSAEGKYLMLRKQIVPLLKEELEKNIN